MPQIVIVANTRAERGPLESVIAALPEAHVVGVPEATQRADPAMVMGLAIPYFQTQFEILAAKVVVVLGDRYETLAAALAATFLRIRLVHIHGGETTTGAFDDALRDSITRLADVHCCATLDASYRVEELQRTSRGQKICVVGAPGLDGVAPRSATRADKLILVTYHPETRAADYGVAGCKAMLEAIPLGYEVVFCGVNNDPGATEIRAAIAEHTSKRGAHIDDSLTHAQYIALMQRASLVIGNSSAGLIEAPWVGVPSVNIGHRQLGRPSAPSVLTAPPVRSEIVLAIKEALHWSGPWEPCYRGGAAPRIAEIVRGLA